MAAASISSPETDDCGWHLESGLDVPHAPHAASENFRELRARRHAAQGIRRFLLPRSLSQSSPPAIYRAAAAVAARAAPLRQSGRPSCSGAVKKLPQ
jgi:hypothetical protein